MCLVCKFMGEKGGGHHVIYGYNLYMDICH